MHLLASLCVKTIEEKEILVLERVLYAILFPRFITESSRQTRWSSRITQTITQNALEEMLED